MEGYGNKSFGGDRGNRRFGGRGGSSYGGGNEGSNGGNGGFGGGGFQQRSFSPVKVGDELTITIEAVGEKGDGIGKVKGFVLFVPNTKEGQQVKVRVTRVLRKVGFAEVVGEGSTTEGSASAEQAQEELVPEGEASEDFGEEASAESTESDDLDESSEEQSEEENVDEPPAPQ